MARVPDASQVSPVGVAGLDSGARSVAQRAGSAVEQTGRAAQQAMRTATNLATTLRNNRRQAEDDGFTSSVTTRARGRFQEVFLESRNQATEGAEDFTATFNERLEQETEALIAEARANGGRPSDRAVQDTRDRLGLLGASFTVKAATFENNARVDKLTRDLGGGLDDLALQSFNDPERREALLGAAKENIDQASFLPAATRAALRESSRTAITIAAVKGLIDRDAGLATDMLRGGDFDGGLEAGQKASLLKEAGAAKARENAERERSQRVEERRAISEAADIAVVLETGRQASGVEDAKERLELIGTERAADALDALEQAERDGADLTDFVLSPLSEQRAAIRALQTKDEVSREELAKLGRFQRAHAALATGLAREPFETAIAFGVIDEVAPVDFGDVRSMVARSEQADLIGETYGVEITPLSASETAALEGTLDQATPSEATAVLANMSEGFGQDQVEQIAGAFKVSRPHLSMAVFHSTDNLPLSADIIEGARILRDNADLRPTPSEMEDLFVTVYGDLFEFMPDLRAPFRESAVALYASKVVGSTDKGFQDDAFELSLREVAGAAVSSDGEVTGGPFEMRGRTVLPPAPGLGREDFINGVTALGEQDLTAFGNGAPVDIQGRPIALADIQSEGIPVSLGFGRYAIMFDGLGFVSRSDATPGEAIYILDLGTFLEANPQAREAAPPGVFEGVEF